MSQCLMHAPPQLPSAMKEKSRMVSYASCARFQQDSRARKLWIAKKGLPTRSDHQSSNMWGILASALSATRTSMPDQDCFATLLTREFDQSIVQKRVIPFCCLAGTSHYQNMSLSRREQATEYSGAQPSNLEKHMLSLRDLPKGQQA